MADIFVSYSRADRDRVAPLVAAIEAKGWSVWWDPHIAPGQEFDRLISTELAAAKAVVVVWTPTSVESRWVRGEAREGADRGILVPVRFERARLPIDVRAIHTIDLDDWAENPATPSCRELLSALGTTITREANATSAQAPASSMPSARDETLCVCVLPFANMSDDLQQEYFSDGISEDIITDLSKVSSLDVIARNTSFQFKGKNVDVPQMARQLKVSHVLEGSVRKAAGRVRITAQLIDGYTGNHVWAERYDRDLNDIFALQDEISEAIVKALRLKLVPAERRAIQQRGTENVEAYNVYLMARNEYVAALAGNAQRYQAIVRLCQRATEIDSGYARAWALMALGQSWLRFVQGVDNDGGLGAAERALKLDAGLAEAHAVRGNIFAEKGELDKASEAVETALRLDPQSHEANDFAGQVRYLQHRFHDAIRFYEKATALVDTDFGGTAMLMSCYAAIGDNAGARRAAGTTIARVEKVLAVDHNNGSALGHACVALILLGQHEQAKEWMKRALLVEPDNLQMRFNFACGLARDLKELDESLDMIAPVLERAGVGLVNHAKADPDLDSLRDHPRFKAMMASAEARLAGETAASA